MKGCNKNKPEIRLNGLKFGCILKKVSFVVYFRIKDCTIPSHHPFCAKQRELIKTIKKRNYLSLYIWCGLHIIFTMMSILQTKPMQQQIATDCQKTLGTSNWNCGIHQTFLGIYKSLVYKQTKNKDWNEQHLSFNYTNYWY